MAPRAWIGYLVGFIASNIWQIWNPHCQKVVEERDVVFDETCFYDSDLPLSEDIPVNLPAPVVETLQLPRIIREADAIESEPSIDLYSDDNDPSNQETCLLIPQEQMTTNLRPSSVPK